MTTRLRPVLLFLAALLAAVPRPAPAQDARLVARADSGEAAAQYLLGQTYEQGRGVIQDYVTAHVWYNLAAAGGDERAARARDALARRMTADQVADAQRRAASWRPKAPAPGVAGLPPLPDATPPRYDPTAPLPRPAQAMSQTETIEDIQRELARLGFDPGPIDGVLGLRTQAAIRDYQASRGLAETGEPSTTLLASLRQDRGRARVSAPVDGDERAWEAARRADSFTSYLDYVRRYPNGRHVAAANQRLDELSGYNDQRRQGGGAVQPSRQPSQQPPPRNDPYQDMPWKRQGGSTAPPAPGTSWSSSPPAAAPGAPAPRWEQAPPPRRRPDDPFRLPDAGPDGPMVPSDPFRLPDQRSDAGETRLHGLRVGAEAPLPVVIPSGAIIGRWADEESGQRIRVARHWKGVTFLMIDDGSRGRVDVVPGDVIGEFRYDSLRRHYVGRHAYAPRSAGWSGADAMTLRLDGDRLFIRYRDPPGAEWLMRRVGGGQA